MNDSERLVRQTAAQSLLELGSDAAPALPGIMAGLERWKEDSQMASILCRCLAKLAPMAGQAVRIAEEVRRIHPNLREAEEAWRAIQRAAGN